MITSFGDKRTKAVWQGARAKGMPQDILRRAQVKLAAIHAARVLDDLRVPPSNRLEVLHGDRVGQYSIRINDQWRICFSWHDGAASDVCIVDYH